VQQAIRRLAEGRTTLVIAHRLNTVIDAHIIHVVENGLIVESGNHAGLMREGRRYADFYRLQFAKQLRTEAGNDVVSNRLASGQIEDRERKKSLTS
jgi:ATP-binding cassette subfamily B protein